MPSTRDVVTLVIPTYDDFDSFAPCLVANQMMHGPELDQIVVVDNNPDSFQGELTRRFCSQQKLVRYTAMKEARGTAVAKNRAIESAPDGFVVCIDSHVLLAQGAVSALRKWLRDYPQAKHDLIHGPLVLDNLAGVNTHFTDKWSDGMKGQWAYNPKVEEKRPFTIPAMGLGCFVVHRSTWPGFNPNFRGFGGEEWYIQEKYRKAGNKVWCFPSLLWWHRFARGSGKVSHPVRSIDKFNNYRTGWLELGLDVKEVDDHFRTIVSPDEFVQVVSGGYQPHKEVAAGCSGCGGTTAFANLDMAERVAEIPSDISEHVPTLREYAGRCDTVLDVGSRIASTIALSRAKLAVYHLGIVRAGDVESLATHTRCKLAYGVPGQKEVQPQVPDHDLLFLDTDPHTFDNVYAQLRVFAGKTRKYVVLHDTETFGQVGTDGKPGIRYAVAEFLRQNPKWTKVREDRNNNGLMVLSCLDDDKKDKVGIGTKIKNFSKAKFKHLMAGEPLTPDDVAAARLAECDLCEWRNGEECTACGCPVGKKVTFATEACPIGRWKAVELPMV